MRVSVAVVEDEDQAAQSLKQCLSQFGEKTENEFSIAWFSDAVSFLRQYQPVYDIVFMDIRMPGMDGMSAARKLREKDPVATLVFVTSIVGYAVQGYSVNALDFIVKPIQYTAFAMRMKRIMEAVRMKKGTGILVSTGNGNKVLSSQVIYFVEVLDHNLTYHTEQGDYTVREKLGNVEKQLANDSFFRCSASHLINLRYLTQLNGESVIVAGQEIRVSRSKKKELTMAVAAYLGKGL